MIRLWPYRRNGEPTGFWPAMPRVGSRWRIGGDVYVLVEYQVGDGLRLQYQRLGSWEAGHLVDPHADCRRRRRRFRWPRRTML